MTKPMPDYLTTREVADLLDAMEVGDLEAVGYTRRSHISMSIKRVRGYSTPQMAQAGA